MKKNDLLVVIAAAGVGERFGQDIPKQYAKINHQTVIEMATWPFINSKYVSKIIIAISKEDVEIEKQSFYGQEKIEFIYGGKTRQESIYNALKNTNKKFNYVITHDAARPNIFE